MNAFNALEAHSPLFGNMGLENKRITEEKLPGSLDIS